jgi:hypothetical protein
MSALTDADRLTDQNSLVRFRQPQRRSIALGERGNMKKDDARLAVLREFDRWAKAHPSKAKEMGGFVFFRYLEKEKPDLLDFRGGASKWQIVHLWLRHGGRLED